MTARGKRQGQFGYSLSELLVALGLSSVVLLSVMSQYSMSTRLNHDHNIRIATMLEAQALLQTIGSEVRMMGNGVPFDQSNFQIGESTLSDPTVTEPVQVATATTSHIAFRLNETGDTFLLTADFDPTSSLDIFLTDVSSLDVNDPIYISNSVVSGNDGFYGIVSAVDSGAMKITVSGTYQMSPGATFDMGSVLEEVPVVTYDSPVSGTGITRNSGFGAVLMGANTTMTLSYLNASGGTVSLPLTQSSLVDTLRAIRVTVTKTSSSKLTSGQPLTLSVSQTFGIRNLNYLY